MMPDDNLTDLAAAGRHLADQLEEEGYSGAILRRMIDAHEAALRAARDREAAMREALDKFTSTVGFDPDSNLHLDAWSIAEAALTDTDTAAQDWRERVKAEGRRDGLRKAAETCDFFAKLWGERGDERGRDMQEGAARCNAHILALIEEEDRDG